jgi:hypothetical protein
MSVALHEEAGGKVLHGWTLGAMWQDFKLDLRPFSDIEHLAMDGDHRWEAALLTICKPCTRAAIRDFDEPKADESVAWINEAIAQRV